MVECDAVPASGSPAAPNTPVSTDRPVLTPAPHVGGKQAPHPAAGDAVKSLHQTTPSHRHSKKMRQHPPPTKLKITIGGRQVTNDEEQSTECIEEEVPLLDSFQCEEVVSEEIPEQPQQPEPVVPKTVPALRIKLNASKGTAELANDTNSTPGVKLKSENGSEKKKRKKSPASAPPKPIAIESNHLNHTSDHFEANDMSNHSDSNQRIGMTAASADLIPESNTSFTSPESVDMNKKSTSRSTSKTAKSTNKSATKRPNITAYTLWCRENRPKVQQLDPSVMDFASASRALGEMWQNLPNNEKLQWKLKADKLKNGAVLMKETGPPQPDPLPKSNNTLSVRTPAASSASTTPSHPHQPVRRIVSSTKASDRKSAVSPAHAPASNFKIKPRKEDEPVTPIEVSSHLRLLGESLSQIGRRMYDQRDQATDSRSLTPLLDSTLCALAPLLALTSLDPRMNGCDPVTHSKTLENLSYIMPGI